MELTKEPESRGEFSAEFNRELVERIVMADTTLEKLADETGIPPHVMSKWDLMVERAEAMASDTAEVLAPSSRVLELEREIDDLKRQLGRQVMTIQILEKKGLL